MPAGSACRSAALCHQNHTLYHDWECELEGLILDPVHNARSAMAVSGVSGNFE